ncbi:hypothetical protein Ddye_012510 [Dipteronia dyeriana]|uniref:Reverse transcriptase domain-containing protein n=1 Tax=Dipteronia dyeriana TaxID=168575 RepID=A0AAD9X4H0_9ROSI|nr:hypothetical protein Ddye_012510 [Dipteronia dyeriana]
MSKAYDRVEWAFLRGMMHKLGFSEKWVNLVMDCVSTATYSFKLNGEVMGNIIPSRGLRQRDPLSSYLFLICVKGLSSLIREALASSKISDFKCSKRAPIISHLFFADDSLLFTKDDDKNCLEIRKVLETYSITSGQLVNYGLGEKLLSVGGKEILVKAVVQSIPTYAMSLFKLPKSLIVEIQRLTARFLWGGNENNRKIHWCTWKRLCKPKSEGGLGFRNLEIFNKALLTKQCWRILKFPDSLAARTLKGYYFPNCDFLDATKRSTGSFIWNSLLWGRDILEKGLRWRVGNGNSIWVYKDNWVTRPNTFKILSSPSLGVNIKVNDLFSPSGGWNLDLLKLNFLDSDIEAILNIPLGSGTRDDTVIWHFEGNGVYSVKSGYWLGCNWDQNPSRSHNPEWSIVEADMPP